MVADNNNNNNTTTCLISLTNNKKMVDMDIKISFPSIPCKEMTNLNLWRQFFKDMTLLNQTNEMRNVLLQCTLNHTDCFHNGMCSLEALSQSQSQSSSSPVIDLSASLLNQKGCMDCIMSGDTCGRYNAVMRKYACFIHAMMQSQVYVDPSESHIRTFLILLLKNCCGVVLTEQQQEVIQNLDVMQLSYDIENVVETYLTPGATLPSTTQKSWFDQHKGLVLFLILLSSSLVLLIVFGLIYFRSLPATTYKSTRTKASRQGSRAISGMDTVIPHEVPTQFNIDDVLRNYNL